MKINKPLKNWTKGFLGHVEQETKILHPFCPFYFNVLDFLKKTLHETSIFFGEGHFYLNKVAYIRIALLIFVVSLAYRVIL